MFLGIREGQYSQPIYPTPISFPLHTQNLSISGKANTHILYIPTLSASRNQNSQYYRRLILTSYLFYCQLQSLYKRNKIKGDYLHTNFISFYLSIVMFLSTREGQYSQTMFSTTVSFYLYKVMFFSIREGQCLLPVYFTPISTFVSIQLYFSVDREG